MARTHNWDSRHLDGRRECMDCGVVDCLTEISSAGWSCPAPPELVDQSRMRWASVLAAEHGERQKFADAWTQELWKTHTTWGIWEVGVLCLAPVFFAGLFGSCHLAQAGHGVLARVVLGIAVAAPVMGLGSTGFTNIGRQWYSRRIPFARRRPRPFWR